jgi:hypothetical protein
VESFYFSPVSKGCFTLVLFYNSPSSKKKKKFFVSPFSHTKKKKKMWRSPACIEQEVIQWKQSLIQAELQVDRCCTRVEEVIEATDAKNFGNDEKRIMRERDMAINYQKMVLCTVEKLEAGKLFYVFINETNHRKNRTEKEY